MKPDEFKEAHIMQIFKLYKEHCGGRGNLDRYIDNRYGDAKKVLKEILSNSIVAQDGYRIGSKWTCNSKLRFERDWTTGDVLAKFNINLPLNDPKYEDARIAGEKFEKATLEYLCNTQ